MRPHRHVIGCLTSPTRRGDLIYLRLRGIYQMTRLNVSLFALLFLVSAGRGNAASWSKLTSPAPSSIQLMVQMTDGTILVQSYDGQSWMKLTPDATGSYINGTWS